MNLLPKIYFYGPSFKPETPAPVDDIVACAESEVVRQYVQALQNADYDGVRKAQREKLMQDRPDFAAVQTSEYDRTKPVWRHSMGPCLMPHIKESDFLLHTVDPPERHRLCGYRLVDQPEDQGFLKVYLGTLDIMDGDEVIPGFTPQPKKLHFFAQSNPFLVFMVADHDVATMALAKHGTIEGDFPFAQTEWDAIYEAFAAMRRCEASADSAQ